MTKANAERLYKHYMQTGQIERAEDVGKKHGFITKSSPPKEEDKKNKKSE